MIKRIAPILVLTVACWVVLVANAAVWHGALNQHGIIPRQAAGLPGILWSPLLHGSIQHLAANTIPLLILGAILCGRSPGEFVIVTVAGTLLGGALTWLFARGGSHIGASGLIFTYFGYLASLAVFDRKLLNLLLSLACLIVYGGMLRGLFPSNPAVSWEGHAAGLIAGIVLAWFVAKVNRYPLNGEATPAAKSS